MTDAGDNSNPKRDDKGRFLPGHEFGFTPENAKEAAKRRWETAEEDVKNRLAERLGYASWDELPIELQINSSLWIKGRSGAVGAGDRVLRHSGLVQEEDEPRKLTPFQRQIVEYPAFASVVEKLIGKNADRLLKQLRAERKRRQQLSKD